ncbi:hypothetical protein SCUP515_00677 [Seiridium cupressi]
MPRRVARSPTWRNCIWLRVIQTDVYTQDDMAPWQLAKARICRSIFGRRAAQGPELEQPRWGTGYLCFGYATFRGAITSSGDEGMLEAPGLEALRDLTRLGLCSAQGPIRWLAADSAQAARTVRHTIHETSNMALGGPRYRAVEGMHV